MALDAERRDGVLEITLSRPEAMNAFTVDMHSELAAALKEAATPDVRAVLITGAGRAFCAGQDLQETLTQDLTPGDRLEQCYIPNMRALAALEKPVVAALNGVAAGAGVGLALACDVRIASERASFVPAFIAIGLVPDNGTSWYAVRSLGYARAFDWLTSNRKLGASEAHELGLVSEVVAPDELLERARTRAIELAERPGLGVGLTKRLLSAAGGASLQEQLDAERRAQQTASEHPAYREQVEAFLTKSGCPRAAGRHPRAPDRAAPDAAPRACCGTARRCAA
jgi:2-(1,2-epoxy-1,2-dihydrophenyl)acetyl-CoA isomerase